MATRVFEVKLDEDQQVQPVEVPHFTDFVEVISTNQTLKLVGIADFSNGSETRVIAKLRRGEEVEGQASKYIGNYHDSNGVNWYILELYG